MDKEAVLSLLSQRKEISNFLFEHNEELAHVKQIRKIESSKWILELADNITLTTRAPSAWAPSRPLHEFRGHPPAPQFEQMRAGMLEKIFHSNKVIIDNLAKETEVENNKTSRSKIPILNEEKVEMYIGKNAPPTNMDESESDDSDDDYFQSTVSTTKIAQVIASNNNAMEISSLLPVEEPVVQVQGHTRQTQMTFGDDDSDSSDDEDMEDKY